MSTNPSTLPTQPRSPVLDAAILASLRALEDDEAGFLAEVIALFHAETPLRIAAIGRAASCHATRELVQAAHALKGSARTLGLLRLAEIGQQVESLGLAGRLPDVAALARLDAEYASATQALAELPPSAG